MRERIFIDEKGLELVVKSRKSAVFFEIIDKVEEGQTLGYNFEYKFSLKELTDFKNYLNTIGNESWNNFSPGEWNSMGADYYEYYDREFGNNGYLSIRLGGKLKIDRPILESNRLYKFNKLKFQAFVYDLGQHLENLKEEL